MNRTATITITLGYIKPLSPPCGERVRVRGKYGLSKYSVFFKNYDLRFEFYPLCETSLATP